VIDEGNANSPHSDRYREKGKASVCSDVGGSTEDVHASGDGAKGYQEKWMEGTHDA
jgi:hypothetical protein